MNFTDAPLKQASAALLVAALCSCTTPSREFGSRASAQLLNSNGQIVGAANLLQSTDRLILNIQVAGLPSGEKALHIHSIGDCTLPDFKSAGGHLNPFGREHGHLNPNGQHMGDLENITISQNGSAATTIELPGTPDEIMLKLMDSDGSAIMIHAGPDDYASDPAGAAGPRIACGVFKAE